MALFGSVGGEAFGDDLAADVVGGQRFEQGLRGLVGGQRVLTLAQHHIGAAQLHPAVEIVALFLKARGYRAVRVLEGGMEAWAAAPVDGSG